MPYGLYISAEGAHVQSKRLETIANNLANVDTVGFKRELAVFQARYAEAITQGMASPGSGGIDDLGGGVTVQRTKTDFSVGPLKHTGIPTDLAIDGEGFFLVERDGERMLTRAGNFRLTATGELITQQGYPVLNEALNPVLVNPLGGPWEVTTEGVVRQQGGAVQSLAVVRPASLDELEKQGENLFRAAGEPEMVPPAGRRIASGYLEASAVKPTNEMIALIETSRILEANINLMKTQDQMLGGLVGRLLRA
jgi:flagellar basal-body rod protein FlgF